MKYLVKKNDKENYATNDNADEDYPKSIDRAVAIEQTEKGSGYFIKAGRLCGPISCQRSFKLQLKNVLQFEGLKRCDWTT